jgi:hypothetical protein
MVEITRKLPPDITITNPAGEIYQRGKEGDDDSFRIVIDDENENFQFESKKNNVWNTAGHKIAQASTYYGRVLKVSGAGEVIQTTGVVTGTVALVPFVPYTEEGTGQPLSPDLGPLVIQGTPVPPTDSEFLVSGFAGFISFNEAPRLATAVWVEIGTVAPTTPIRFRIRQGVSGPLLYDQLYPPELFVANSKVRLQLDGGGFPTAPGTAQFYTFISEPFSIFAVRRKSGVGFWYAFDYYPYDTQVLWTDNQADRILTSKNGEVLVNREGNVLLSR